VRDHFDQRRAKGKMSDRASASNPSSCPGARY
jgi:hypothetical protein